MDMTKFPAEAYDREPENGPMATQYMMTVALNSKSLPDMNLQNIKSFDHFGEFLNIFNRLGLRKVEDCLHFLWVGLNSSFTNHES